MFSLLADALTCVWSAALCTVPAPAVRTSARRTAAVTPRAFVGGGGWGLKLMHITKLGMFLSDTS